MDELVNFNLNLKFLKQFLDLSEFKTMGQYAKKAGVSPQQISNSVAELEKKIGCELLIRTKLQREIILTPAGRELIKHIPGIFEKISLAIDGVTSLKEDMGKVLELFTTEYLIANLILPNLSSFEKNYPDLHLNLFPLDYIPSASERTKMVAICPRASEESAFQQIFLKKYDIRLWATQEYLVKNGIPESVEDLKKHKLICYQKKFDESQYPTMAWYLKQYNIEVPENNLIILKLSSGILQAASSHKGIIAISRETVKVSGCDFTEVLPKLKGPLLEMVLSYPNGYKDSYPLDALKRFLQTIF